MMIKKMHKNILGLFLIGLTLYAICYLNVNAEENPNKCSESALSERYKGLKVRVDGTTATIYANQLSEGLNGVKFTLVRINNVYLDSQQVTVESKKTEKANSSNSKSIDLNVSRYGISNNVATLYFKVENDANSGCNNIEHKVTVEGVGRSPKIDTYKEPEYDLSKITYGRDINCDSPKDNFETAICKVRKEKNEKNDNPNVSNLFKCNYKSAYKADDLKDECYYKEENTSYLYRKETKEVGDLGSYVYHFSPGVASDPEHLTCEQECEEAVEVKYGPPVASKAGMCFEYKVKVVSRVNCHSKADIPKPTNYNVCTPTPICTNGSWSGNNGGPNEEFDSCIKSCDGGKYTKSCSKKCYKQVYGKSNKLSNNLAINYATKLSDIEDAKETCAKNNKTCDGKNCYGCYYKTGDTINWYAQGMGKKTIALGTCVSYNCHYSTPFAPGRWYYYNYWGNTSYYETNDNGIFKAPDCSDDCYWAGCSGDVYLNKYNYDEDFKQNQKTYENAVNKCKAAASCSESTATFTIKAGYKSGGKSEIKWIDFPYNNKEDKIESKSDSGFVSWTRDNNDTTLIDDKYDCKVSSNGSCTSCLNKCSSGDTSCINNCKKDSNCDLLPDNGNRGCYDQNTNKTDRYRATWTFPYTYINLKTGEVSYKNLSGSPAWFKEDKKFCIPLDADDINEKWWNYYYGKTTESLTNKLSTSSSESNCASKFSDGSDLKDTDIDWNIKANTSGFGYFKWKIEVNCFYALNSKGGTISKEGVKEINCTPSSDNFRVRSVQLNNLFPTTSGEEGSRNPGFNWSTYASTVGKNANYASTPIELTNFIQKHADDIYSDKYLDYEFNLSKSTLKDMKKEVEKSGLNYTNFDDNGFGVGSDTGVSRYISKKIREDLPGNNKIPNTSALKCNNMENWESSNCEDLSK